MPTQTTAPTTRKRALIIAGAGAALEFGAPSMADLTAHLRQFERADRARATGTGAPPPSAFGVDPPAPKRINAAP